MNRCRILYVASEFAPGMMPFAASIVNIAKEQNIFEVYAFFVNSKGRHYNSLVTLNVIQTYCEQISQILKNPHIVSVSFRNKDAGWKNYNIEIKVK